MLQNCVFTAMLYYWKYHCFWIRLSVILTIINNHNTIPVHITLTIPPSFMGDLFQNILKQICKHSFKVCDYCFNVCNKRIFEFIGKYMHSFLRIKIVRSWHGAILLRSRTSAYIFRQTQNPTWRLCSVSSVAWVMLHYMWWRKLKFPLNLVVILGKILPCTVAFVTSYVTWYTLSVCDRLIIIWWRKYYNRLRFHRCYRPVMAFAHC